MDVKQYDPVELFRVTQNYSGLLRITQGYSELLRDQEEGGALKLAQKRSWAGRYSWDAKVEILSLRVVPQQQCNEHCQRQLRSALVAVHTALTLPLSGRRSTVSPVFFGRYPCSLHSLALFPPPPPPPAEKFLISNLASVDIKQYGQGQVESHANAGSLLKRAENSVT